MKNIVTRKPEPIRHQPTSKHLVDVVVTSGVLRRKAGSSALRERYGLPTEEEVARSEAEAKHHLKEMCAFVVFILLLTFALLFGRNDETLYFWTDAVTTQLTDDTWRSVHTVDQMYEYLEGPFHATLWTAASWDGDDAFPGSPRAEDGGDVFVGANWPGYVLGHGYLVGGVRIGQIRSDLRECNTPSELPFPAGQEPRCFGPRGSGEPPPLPGWPEAIRGLEADSESREPLFSSYVTAEKYGAPTVFLSLPHHDEQPTDGSPSPVIARLRELQDAKFVDLYTRAVLIDLSLYHPSLDYMMVIRLNAEMPVSGGVVTSHKLSTLRLYRYFTTGDALRLTAETLVMVMVVAYTWIEVKLVRRMGFRAYANVDSTPHLLNLGLFYVTTLLKLLSWLELPADVDPVGDAFFSYRSSASLYELAQDVMAFNAFLSWLKLVKYASFVPRFGILLGTLKRASGKVGSFGIICGVVLFGASQSFTLAFGTVLYGYRNLTQSLFTLTRALLGDFAFEDLRVANPLLGPLMFFLFIGLSVFVLLNMFIAIISDAYNDTKEEIEATGSGAAARHNQRVGKALGRLIFNHGLYRVPCLGPLIQAAFMSDQEYVRRRLVKATRAQDVHALLELADENANGEVSAEELMAHLGGYGHGSVSIDLIVDTLKRMGMNAAEATKMAENLDVNHDGVITTRELEPLLLGAHAVAESAAAESKDAAHVDVARVGDDSSSTDSSSAHGSAAAERMRKTAQKVLSQRALADLRLNLMTQQMADEAELQAKAEDPLHLARATEELTRDQKVTLAKLDELMRANLELTTKVSMLERGDSDDDDDDIAHIVMSASKDTTQIRRVAASGRVGTTRGVRDPSEAGSSGSPRVG